NLPSLIFAGGNNFFSLFFRPDSVISMMGVVTIFFKFRIVPTAIVRTRSSFKGCVYLPVILGYKAAYFFFSFGNNGEGRGLHPANRCFKKAAAFAVKGRHSSRAINSNEPIGFGTRACSISEWLHSFIISKRLEGFPNSGLRHRS